MKQLRNFNRSANTNKSDNEFVDEAMRKYGDLDEDALIGQLMNKVRQSRQDGTYNPQELSNFASMLSPHMNQSQREKLANIINLLNQEDV